MQNEEDADGMIIAVMILLMVLASVVIFACARVSTLSDARWKDISQRILPREGDDDGKQAEKPSIIRKV